MQITNAEVINTQPQNSTFNVLLSFKNDRKAMLNCRVEGGKVAAYNISVVGGTCPCCLKPNCSSLYAKRHELLVQAQQFTNFPMELTEK
ncbi:hypothetical protein [Neobacillus dielmonensis]|uniref:hypothetical protein n=1 Tax=Neobacillus dielmonensis TaxID=1347369 RepID=UPI0005A7EA5C|nr:hypothetical protein [Neobacillus dielmonensis]